MSIHLRPFMQRTPPDSLKLFLAGVSTTAFDDLDWTSSRPILVDRIGERLLSLDDPARDHFYAEVDRIGQFMMDPYGRSALRAVLPPNSDFMVEFDGLEDVTACAVHVLLNRQDAFENALSAVYLQRYLNGRDWTGFDFELNESPRLRSDPGLRQLGTRIADIFPADGPRPRIAVERFSRHESDGAGLAQRTREQFTIYVEAPPESALAFTIDSRVEPHVTRPVQEGAILFDPDDRTLDIVARRAGKVRRREIAEAFVETILEPGTALVDRSRRTLFLDTLKTRPAFDVRADDGIQSVQVVRLVVVAPDSAATVTIEVRGRGDRHGGTDLYERAERALGRDCVLNRPGWPVVSAKLRILFEPERPKARAKSATFELKAPDRTNLRDHIELHRRVADTLLARWGLYAAED